MRRPTSSPLFATAEAAEEAFYEAIERADVDAMMALWADEEDAVCVLPGSARLVGLPAIRAAWEELFRGGGRHVRPTEVRAVQGATLAVHNVVEQTVVDGRLGTEMVRVLATNVYVKGPIGWQIVMHQAGTAVIEPAESQSPAASPAMLH